MWTRNCFWCLSLSFTICNVLMHVSITNMAFVIRDCSLSQFLLPKAWWLITLDLTCGPTIWRVQFTLVSFYTSPLGHMLFPIQQIFFENRSDPLYRSFLNNNFIGRWLLVRFDGRRNLNRRWIPMDRVGKQSNKRRGMSRTHFLFDLMHVCIPQRHEKNRVTIIL